MIIGSVVLPHPPAAVPKIGYRDIDRMKATEEAYEKAAEFVAKLRPETIIVTSPHATMYRDYFNISGGRSADGNFGQFRAPQVKFHVQYDTDFIGTLAGLCEKQTFPAGTDYDRDPELDHGTMVPLYFIRQEYSDFQLVRIGLSGLSLRDHYRLGQLIQEAVHITGRRVLFLASGDLSHCQKVSGPYGYKKEGPEYDRRIMQDLGNADFGKFFTYPESFLEKSMECGHRSFVIMAGALDRTAVKAQILSHEAPFGVGYGVVTFETAGRDESRDFLEQFERQEEAQVVSQSAREDAYVTLARQSVNSWVKYHRVLPLPDGLPQEMTGQRAGVFVSLHEDGELRGCIGTIRPAEESIAKEIIQNAISAASRDPRFDPVRPEELKILVISVDVLSDPEPIESLSKLDPERFGVIVSKGMKRGLLLPRLEGVDTVEEQIRIACRKAGLDPDEDDIRLQRFEVVRHEVR
ncbi:MAG: AmmeMemoRadiSam system protein A [Lachnospiraceae bacterium]|jgi:AmmeMemoRadiSam system protein A/AmmeMemoRadiSam system protein B|nr:AmmeMemoRadiSam system protein A [Lachnospiraceae bacterium]MCH4030165.1 AmmeMemoRadiSam system protein A [Lachnospiraceae bacterium]MCH4069377.1 AmmeMemoRadiSam system protein A [Lachnospiraceae bacterium]MCH4107687.1 AmmeMemoRadiSam system protein A [Lachnospiraceae bacterium]MCI1301462.1 AmmeMemoRadiSam system protein A [Lachnospiraceae bacterium]